MFAEEYIKPGLTHEVQTNTEHRNESKRVGESEKKVGSRVGNGNSNEKDTCIEKSEEENTHESDDMVMFEELKIMRWIKRTLWWRRRTLPMRRKTLRWRRKILGWRTMEDNVEEKEDYGGGRRHKGEGRFQ